MATARNSERDISFLDRNNSRGYLTRWFVTIQGTAFDRQEKNLPGVRMVRSGHNISKEYKQASCFFTGNGLHSGAGPFTGWNDGCRSCKVQINNQLTLLYGKKLFKALKAGLPGDPRAAAGEKQDKKE